MVFELFKVIVFENKVEVNNVVRDELILILEFFNYERKFLYAYNRDTGA